MNRHNSKSGLFLMEMIIVILFFSICSAICVNVFAAARITADHSNDLNNAAVRAASAAETFKSAHGDIKTTADLLSSESDGDIETMSYDSNMITTEYSDMTLYLEVKGEQLADITVRSSKPSYSSQADESGNAEIFSMTVRAEEAES